MSPRISTASGETSLSRSLDFEITWPIVSAAFVSSGLEEEVRLPNFQIFKEDLIELVIIVLAGVNQDMLCVAIQSCNNARKSDDFRQGYPG